jgi:hypothetical protein
MTAATIANALRLRAAQALQLAAAGKDPAINRATAQDLARQAAYIERKAAGPAYDARQADEAAAFALVPHNVEFRRDTTRDLFGH